MGAHGVAVEGFAAGIVASVACGLGALPLAWRGLRAEERIGLAYALAGGLMFAASVYNLLLPAFTLGAAGATRAWPVAKTLGGMGLGCLFLWAVERGLTPARLALLRPLGGRVGALIFVAMAFHSIPEGVAVGVGYSAEDRLGAEGLGLYIAAAIAIHNVPEGLAVALPMRAAGASIPASALAAFLTSLPQPLAAVPAALATWFFEPLMLPMLGFAAGAMMYLVVTELIPDALETRTRAEIAWAFMAGFGAMVAVQVAL